MYVQHGSQKKKRINKMKMRKNGSLKLQHAVLRRNTSSTINNSEAFVPCNKKQKKNKK